MSAKLTMVLWVKMWSLLFEQKSAAEVDSTVHTDIDTTTILPDVQNSGVSEVDTTVAELRMETNKNTKKIDMVVEDVQQTRKDLAEMLQILKDSKALAHNVQENSTRAFVSNSTTDPDIGGGVGAREMAGVVATIAPVPVYTSSTCGGPSTLGLDFQITPPATVEKLVSGMEDSETIILSTALDPGTSTLLNFLHMHVFHQSIE